MVLSDPVLADRLRSGGRRRRDELSSSRSQVALMEAIMEAVPV
jgi:hypothetical protein